MSLYSVFFYQGVEVHERETFSVAVLHVLIQVNFDETIFK
jgi:hypothetical protein